MLTKLIETNIGTYSNTRKEVESISRKLDFDLNEKDSSTSEQFHDLGISSYAQFVQNIQILQHKNPSYIYCRVFLGGTNFCRTYRIKFTAFH